MRKFIAAFETGDLKLQAAKEREERNRKRRKDRTRAPCSVIPCFSEHQFEFFICLEITCPLFQMTAVASDVLQQKDKDLAA